MEQVENSTFFFSLSFWFFRFSIAEAIDLIFIRIKSKIFTKTFEKNRWKNFVRREKWAEKKSQKVFFKISKTKSKNFFVTNLFFLFSSISFSSFSFLVNYKKHNDSKNVFAFSRTPTTFISTMILCYLIAGILDMIWLGGLNFVFMFAFWLCFVLLFIWLYAKYSGEYVELGEYVDFFADVIWNNVRRRKEKRKEKNKSSNLLGVLSNLFNIFTFSDAFSFGTNSNRMKIFLFIMFFFFFSACFLLSNDFRHLLFPFVSFDESSFLFFLLKENKQINRQI